MPSGTLWMPIATATGTATSGAWMAAMKVANPSGKLCRAMTMAVSSPRRWRAVASGARGTSCGFIGSGTRRSTITATAMPPKKDASATQPLASPRADASVERDCGTSSASDT